MVTVKLNKVKQYFTERKIKRAIFAIRQGEYKGHFFVYINRTEDKYNFLVLPFNTTASVPVEQFNQGVDNKIVDYIEKLPNNVHEICCAQYNESKAKSDIDRLKQSAAPSSVDRRERKNKRKS